MIGKRGEFVVGTVFYESFVTFGKERGWFLVMGLVLFL